MSGQAPSPDPPARAVARPGSIGVAVYDANCLFSKHLRYLLLGFAVYRITDGRWSRKLLEETAASLAAKLRGDSLEDLGRWLKTETELIRDGLVTGYERWIDIVELPDAGDVHVLAAAIECGATMIVTANLRDFPADIVSRFDIEAVDPDVFVLRCIDANPVVAARLVEDAPMPERLLERLERDIPGSVQRLRDLLS